MGLGNKIKILLIEDNSGDAYLIEEYLEEFADFSYEFENVGTLNEALSALKEQLFDIIVLDPGLPDSDGINTFIKGVTIGMTMLSTKDFTKAVAARPMIKAIANGITLYS